VPVFKRKSNLNETLIEVEDIMEQKEKVKSYLRKNITRRQALKAGGIAALGLTFSKPFVDTIRPRPVFAEYGGTPGFWNNEGQGGGGWPNEFSEDQIVAFLVEINANSVWLGPTTIAGMDTYIDKVMGGTEEEKFLGHYLILRLNLKSGRLPGNSLHNTTSRDSGNYLGLATPTSATLDQIVAKIESKHVTPTPPPPTKAEFLIMKDVCDALNNLYI